MDVLYAIGTVLGIALTLILRDWRDGKSIFTKNDMSDRRDSYLESKMDYLKAHYNDEITPILANHQKSLDEVKNFQGESNITMVRIQNAIENIEKYGVKVRD